MTDFEFEEKNMDDKDLQLIEQQLNSYQSADILIKILGLIKQGTCPENRVRELLKRLEGIAKWESQKFQAIAAEVEQLKRLSK